MPNWFTRVPDAPVPDLPWIARVLVGPADLFMMVMVSRPDTGSLRTTWVTPGTLALCAGMVVLGLPLAVASMVSGHTLTVVGGCLLLVLVVGSAAVAMVGLAQRRSRS